MTNLDIAWEKLEAEVKRLDEALLLNRAAQNKYRACLEHEQEQEMRFRKERNAVAEALKNLDQAR